MRAKPLRYWLRTLAALALAGVAPAAARAQTSADRKQDVELALDQYGAAKTAAERAAVIDYLKHLDSLMVAEAVVDHIVTARNGVEATAYNKLVEVVKPDGCAAVLERLGDTDLPAAKGKLIVAMRHCHGDKVVAALEGCLKDQRPVPFEVHGPQARRVCDIAYDELYLKFRKDPGYKLDTSAKMKGYITENIPIKKRDALIAKLEPKLPKKSASPTPGKTPAAVKPAEAKPTPSAAKPSPAPAKTEPSGTPA